MTSKTESLYTAVLRHVKGRSGPGPYLVETQVSDYEVAIMEAMKMEFPRARNQGCFFHFSQVCQLFSMDNSDAA